MHVECIFFKVHLIAKYFTIIFQIHHNFKITSYLNKNATHNHQIVISYREIEACSQLLASLSTCLHHLKTLYEWSQEWPDGKKNLFSSDDHSPQELLSKAENVNQYCFYGRCLGFQFCESLKNTLKGLSVAMVSFSEVYYTNGTVLGRCANSLKYFIDPELRARRIVNISQRADIHFCKAFWFLNESSAFFLNYIILLICSISSSILFCRYCTNVSCHGATDFGNKSGNFSST